MSVRLPCPQCGGILGIPEERMGTEVRCHHCGSGFRAPPDIVPVEAATSSIGASMPAERGLTDEPPVDVSEEGWRWVALGIQGTGIAAAITCGTLVVAWLGPYVLPMVGSFAWVVMLGVALSAAWLLNLVGRWCCFALPADDGTRWFVTAAAVGPTVVTLLAASAWLDEGLQGRVFPVSDRRLTGQIILTVALVLFAVGEGAFLVFLHGLGAFLGSQVLRRAVIGYSVALVGTSAGATTIFAWLNAAITRAEFALPLLAISMALSLGGTALLGLANHVLKQARIRSDEANEED